MHKDADAAWTHASMYLGDNAIVEIDQGGVSVNTLFKYVLSHAMLFKRPLDVAGADISEKKGFQIAIAALKDFKRRYALGGLALTAYDCLAGRYKADSRRAIRSEGAICSDFYNESVFAATDRYAAKVIRLPMQPADLSSSSYLRDLPVTWARLT